MKTSTFLKHSIFFLNLFLSPILHAQTVTNDDCATARVISNPNSFCSVPNAETTFGATSSPVPTASCFPTINPLDVWFVFTAEATQMEIALWSGPFSGFFEPTMAVYRGSCANLTEIACSGQVPNIGYVELTLNNLIPGENYYIRIQSTFQGIFQLCTREILQEDLSGDCPTGTIICDKSPKSIGYIAGPGNDPTEWDDADCIASLFIPGEYNSTWFIFTAAENGTLEFTLTPNAPGDDLDFIVYHLPNGPEDCTGKIVERCMLAGSSFPDDPCYGPTGLNATSIDLSEPPNCLPDNDNFLQYMDLVAGETYALSVNNFTSVGGGFSIDWGGTATFLGPKVDLLSDEPDLTLCIGEEIVVRDSILYPGGTIDSRQWVFGVDATPLQSTAQGPHTVQYLSGGLKKLELIVRADLGCLIERTLDIQVDTCCSLLASVDLVPACLPDTTCLDAVAGVENAVQPLTYEWSNGTADSIAVALTDGSYSLIVSDAFSCRDTVSFDVVTGTQLNIPNAFTPNNDDANDVFGPLVKGAEVTSIKIWNRWGLKVYDGSSNGWDGKIDGEPAPSDVYIYQLKLKFPNGREEVKSGDLTLLR
ncbi:MAG: gliding motility-associated C-terminal domain-containing protein [Saprospiraceae bacterium]|nr:gliding motility-associated C-terminal domain-containing protein [Saprospiraceae bacterium]